MNMKQTKRNGKSLDLSVANKNNVNLEESLIVPHDYRQVKIAPNTEVTIDLEDYKKEIEKSIAKSAGLYGGFLNNGG